MKRYPKLFKNQPQIDDAVLLRLERRGFLVPAKSTHVSEGQTKEVSNHTAGEVVGYVTLSDALMEERVSQSDSRLLLAIEASRKGGPRLTHVSRLIISSFITDKLQVIEKVNQWAENHK